MKSILTMFTSTIRVSDNVSLGTWQAAPGALVTRAARKIITRENHPWNYFDSMRPLFAEKFPTDDALFERTILMYRTMEGQRFGPRLYSIEIKDGTALHIIMEFIPQPVSKAYVEDNAVSIIRFIKLVQDTSAGYIHGELNLTNMRIAADGTLRMIDLETMFVAAEADEPIVVEWCKEVFGMRVDQFIAFECTRFLGIVIYENDPRIYE